MPNNVLKCPNKYLLIISGFSLVILWLLLAVWSNQPVPVPVVGMLMVQFIAWLIVISMWIKCRDDEENLSKVMILLFACLMRMPSFYATPIYEDDYFRFLWDGWNFVTSGTPYNGPPENYFDEIGYSEQLQEVLYNVNYPEVPTIYAPICQVFFSLGALIKPLELWSLRLVIFVVEISILFLFSRVASARQLLLLAWCPLLVFESMFQVHPDFLAACFLVLAYFMRKREKNLWVGVFCALALGIKVTVFPCLTFLLWPLRKQGMIAFGVTMVAMYLPFILQGTQADIDGLRVFAREWEFNASLYSLGASYFPRDIVKFCMLGIFVIAFLFIWFSWQRRGGLHHEISQSVVAVYGVLFLVSPVVNSWYLLLILPFICLSPRLWSLAAIIVVSLSYVRGQTLPNSLLDDFQQPIWLLTLEYTIVIALLVYSIAKQRSSSKNLSIKDY